jgi:Rps23 Pro-64 3,4-dihydroxylase Tpa1-like proline 4-hydroxylase
MSGEQRRYVSYLLRLWQTERGGALVWRASLENAHTGERRGFASVADLVAFLEQETAPVDEEQPRAPVGDVADA